MIHLDSHRDAWRVARGGQHRLTGRGTAARDAIPGGIPRRFDNLGDDPGEAA